MERYEGNKVGMRIEYPFYSHTSEKSLHRTPLSLKRIRFYFIRVVRYNLSRFVWREGWKAEPAAAAAVVETRRNERSTRVRTLKNGGSLCISDGVNPLSHRFHGVLCFLCLFLSLFKLFVNFLVTKWDENGEERKGQWRQGKRQSFIFPLRRRASFLRIDSPHISRSSFRPGPPSTFDLLNE